MNGNILMSVAAPPFSSKIGIFLHDVKVVWEYENYYVNKYHFYLETIHTINLDNF